MMPIKCSFLDKCQSVTTLSEQEAMQMRKRMLILALVFCLLLPALSGCGSKVPEAIKNPNTQFLEIHEYEKKEYIVPENYRQLRDGIYAVLDANGAIIGYKKLVERNNQYVWLECDASESLN